MRALRAVAATAVVLAWATAAHADPVFPPSSRIGLVPPEGFAASKSFAGFVKRDIGATIVLTELPKAAFAQIGAGFTDEQLAGRSMMRLGACDGVTLEVAHSCTRVSQSAAQGTFRKWLLIAKFPDRTGMVVVSLPETVVTADASLAEAIEKSLSTTAYRSKVAVSPRDALPFAIGDGTLLKFRNTVAGVGAVFAGPPVAGQPDPMMAVIASGTPLQGVDRRAFGRKAIMSISSVTDVDVQNESTMTVGSLSGVIDEGTGVDRKSGKALYVFQAILFGDAAGYYRMVGIVPKGQRDLYRPEFTRLLNTIEPR